MQEIIFEKCNENYLDKAIELSKISTMKYGKECVKQIGVARPILKENLPDLYIARDGETVVACLLCEKLYKKVDIDWFKCPSENSFEFARGCTNPLYRGRGLIGELAKYIISVYPNSNFYFDTMFAPIKNESCIKAFEKIGFEKLNINDWYDKEHNIQTSWLAMHYKNY